MSSLKQLKWPLGHTSCVFGAEELSCVSAVTIMHAIIEMNKFTKIVIFAISDSQHILLLFIFQWTTRLRWLCRLGVKIWRPLEDQDATQLRRTQYAECWNVLICLTLAQNKKCKQDTGCGPAVQVKMCLFQKTGHPAQEMNCSIYKLKPIPIFTYIFKKLTSIYKQKKTLTGCIENQ